MKVKRPDSTCGRKASCCDLLKRCTSSTKTTVARPARRMASACSTASRMSLTPASTADSAMKCAPVARASSRASVVLPTPGGPHRIIDGSRPDSKATRSGRPGASRWRWPTTSSSVCGRSRSASGTPGGCGGGLVGEQRVLGAHRRIVAARPRRRRPAPPALLLDHVGTRPAARSGSARPRPACWPGSWLNCSSESWPKLSVISTAASSLPRKPTRIDWNGPSLALGVASAHSRPSRAGCGASTNSASSEPPASSAAGVAPSACAMAARTGLVEVGVVDPDLLAVGHDELLEGLACRRSGSGWAARTRTGRSRSSCARRRSRSPSA